MTSVAVNGETLLQWQQEQFQHDKRNHTDIICLPRADRLKHYGLHYAKYAGRIAINHDDNDLITKTIADAVLVFLSSANVLSQRLDRVFEPRQQRGFVHGMLEDITDAAGRFCDACEKIDHFEDFLKIAHTSNLDVFRWILAITDERGLNLERLMAERRKQLSERQFLIPSGA